VISTTPQPSSRPAGLVGWNSRRTFNNFRSLVIVIQTAARRALALKWYRNILARFQAMLYASAATRIQTFYRCHHQRSAYYFAIYSQVAATYMQAMVRGGVARRKYLRLAAAIGKLQTGVCWRKRALEYRRRLLDDEARDCAAVIQKVYRRFLGKQMRCSTVISCCWRCWVRRWEFVVLLDKTRAIQRVWRGYQARRPLREAVFRLRVFSSVLIQATVRRWRAAARYEGARKRIGTCQRVWRMWGCRTALRRKNCRMLEVLERSRMTRSFEM